MASTTASRSTLGAPAATTALAGGGVRQSSRSRQRLPADGNLSLFGDGLGPECVATDTLTFPAILAGDMRCRAIAEHKPHRPWPAHGQAAMPAEVAGPLSWKGWK
jgi:hypothetical protein